MCVGGLLRVPVLGWLKGNHEEKHMVVLFVEGSPILTHTHIIICVRGDTRV